MSSLKVSDLLEFKSVGKVASVFFQTTVAQAAKQMRKHNIGFVLVLKSTEIVGVLSERDIVLKSTADNKVASDQSVSEIMTKDIIFGQLDQGLKEVLELMKGKNIRHLPIKDADGGVAGIVSERDITSFLMSRIGQT